MFAGLAWGLVNSNFLGMCQDNLSHSCQKNWNAILLEMAESAKPYRDIGERPLWRRELTGLDQEEFAQRAGLKRSQYSNWESGSHRLSLNGALAIRQTWGLSLDFLFEGIADALPMNLRDKASK